MDIEEQIAGDIFVRVVVNVINARSRPWALTDKEAELIAKGALEAARAFAKELGTDAAT